ncbi:MAG: DSD1 family PLP-dependent enzyme [Chloroflexi bacterium]|nr:DSD1 family PLP-dependent enzyme [Chloroflexota bacterium]
MPPTIAPVGAPKSEIDTPALLINRELLERNVKRMASYFAGTGVAFRPHAKTHKSVEVARMQIDAGAVGVTCAKLGEAEALAAGGVGDILIANQIIGPIKIARLVALAKKIKIAVAVDDAGNVSELSAAAAAAGVTIRCLVEVNIGMNRCGVNTPEEALVLARQIAGSPGLAFGGIQAYEGHLQNLMPVEERYARTTTDMQKAVDVRRFIEANGIPARVLTGAGTGTFHATMKIPGVTEIQAGSYVTCDAQYKKVGSEFDTALTILSTVVSRPAEDLAVIDIGLKTVTNEFGVPTVLVEGATVLGLSEEHARVKLEGTARNLKIGDKIEVLPTHGCTTINLHDRFYVMEDDRLAAVWNIVGRGQSQ